MVSLGRIKFIREAEKKYHDACYENYNLYEAGSWLNKPVKTVLDLIPYFSDKQGIRVLDLGSGVGRNSIPIAQALKHRQAKVTCIDLLDSAIEKLNAYSKKYNVENEILSVKADIGDYPILKNEYDFIVAVSSLEHVASELIFDHVVNQMAAGTKEDGINCLIVNSEVEEIDIEANVKLDALMEVNIKTDDMINKLNDIYNGWEVINQLVKPLDYKIVRDDREIMLKTNAITYVVRNKR